ncbi:MAG: MFS transporter [Pseudomonadota bacterium]|uniref:MFS transporter n=1 Tax=Caldimonas aquatica TaxID=376175 RepID=A0ABY6MVD6_9BURK|nr:MFS transporter [Schlegelella aquatica]UZD55977.1 MFS transporter [Schlegelella aquatica]
MRLSPDEHVTADALEHGKRFLVRDAAWASLAGSLQGGVVLVGFALALGAGPMQIGLLAAIPLMAQALQLPAIALVERLQQRRKIAVVAVTAARVLILSMALLPWVADHANRLHLLIAMQFCISALGSVCACALNSWLHQLLPRDGLGAFFAKRLFWSTSIACVGTLAAGQLIDRWPFEPALYAYSASFAAAALAGFMSSWALARVPEPRMVSHPHGTVFSRLGQPLTDANFRNFLVFMASWNVASNFAGPFLTVYLMKHLGLSLGTVTTLWVASQVANALTLYLWGRLSDRLSNKAILSVALPAWFTCVLALVFVAEPQPHRFTLPMLYLIHVVMGTASGGIGLANGNIGLKLAPQGQGTAYLAAISLVGSLVGGTAPLLAGAVAEWLQHSQLSLAFHWASAYAEGDVSVFTLTHWEFLFAISAALGLYVLHRLSKVAEGHDISERVVVQQFALEAMRSVNHLSTVGGMLGNLFTFGRLFDRRLYSRSAWRDQPGRPT